jgi:hypothetical protein
MSDVTKPIVLDETAQSFAELFGEKMDNQAVILAHIGSNQSGLVGFNSFADIKLICRLGLAEKNFAVGDQLECAKETAINATVGNSQGTAGITAASVTAQTFIHAIGTTGNADYEFIWDGAVWHLDGAAVELSTYGISVTGSPAVGDEIVVHETADRLIWDVVGVTKYSITLQLHDCYTLLQFDAREALFAFPEGLAAGEYYFTIKSQPWFAGDVNKSLHFTLQNAIPAGGQIVLTNSYNATAENTSIKVYASGTAMAESETATLTAGTTGTNLGDVTVAGSEGINSIHRALLGSNNYEQSAVRQWLNSGKEKGSVWTPQTAFDRPPSWAATTDGWMRGMDDDFLAAIEETEIVVALNTVTDGGGSTTLKDKFFLLARSEVFAGKENNINEGSPYPYYSDNSDLLAAGTGADSNRKKYRNTTAQYWWLRSPSAGNASHVRSVNPDGSVSNGIAYHALGVTPACRIGKSEIAS